MKPTHGTEKYKGSWYTFNVVDIDIDGKEKYEYECVRRTSRCNKGGVEVIPIMRKDGKLYIVFIKNFRYAINEYCIEFPGGLIDDDESIEETAKRELREETGYILSKILTVQRDMQVDPWKSDDMNNIVTAFIDGDAEENLTTNNELDHIEKIEPIIIEWDNAEQEIDKLRKDYRVSSSVGYFLTFKNFMNIINNAQ